MQLLGHGPTGRRDGAGIRWPVDRRYLYCRRQRHQDFLARRAVHVLRLRKHDNHDPGEHGPDRYGGDRASGDRQLRFEQQFELEQLRFRFLGELRFE